MSRGHARTSTSLGPNDPRHRRGQGAAFNESVQVGRGLRTDREGRIEIQPAESVDDLPAIYGISDVGDRITKLLSALRRAGMLED